MAMLQIEYISNFTSLNSIYYMNIETLLKEKGLTKSAFADLLGVPKQTINSLMKNPTLATLERFAAALDVPVRELFAEPEEAKGEELTALIQHKSDYYKATSVDELKKIISQIEEK